MVCAPLAIGGVGNHYMWQIKLFYSGIDHTIYHCAGYMQLIKSLCDSPQQHPIHCESKHRFTSGSAIHRLSAQFTSGCVEEQAPDSPVAVWTHKCQFTSGGAIHRVSARFTSGSAQAPNSPGELSGGCAPLKKNIGLTKLSSANKTSKTTRWEWRQCSLYLTQALRLKPMRGPGK